MTPEVAAAVGNSAWMLTAFALVVLMLPGLAMFYGGMVSAKGVLNTIMMVFGGFAVVAVLWTIIGGSMVLGNSVGGSGLLGDPMEFFGMRGLLTPGPEDALPPILVSGFQLLFAGITVALIAGAVSERMKFGSWMVFAGLWAMLVYFPVAHWVFAFDSADGSVLGGWIANGLGAIDFAGGTAVHINSGVAALALALVLGKRSGFPRVSRPHSLPFTTLGAGILLFGWFGFNGGSALAAGHGASVVVFNTIVAAMAGLLGWLAIEKLKDGHATTLGGMSGLIAGLVGITPACGAVNPLGAIAIGAVCGVVSFFAVSWKFRFGYDDALDVVGIHMVSGFVGTVLVGFFAVSDAPNGVNGLFFGGGVDQLWRQIVAALAVMAYCFIVTLIIALAIKKTMGLRVDRDVEAEGIDVRVHAETAYITEQSAAGVSHPIGVALNSQSGPGVDGSEPDTRVKGGGAHSAAVT